MRRRKQGNRIEQHAIGDRDEITRIRCLILDIGQLRKPLRRADGQRLFARAEQYRLFI